MAIIHGPLGKFIYTMTDAFGRLREHNLNEREQVAISRRLEREGITGNRRRGVFAAHTGPSNDALRLAHMLAYSDYTNDPMAQARFVAMLKQLGYLQRQAY